VRKERVEIPVYEGVNVRTFFCQRARIPGIETTFSVTFERDDTEMKAKGFGICQDGDMNMRIYSFASRIPDQLEDGRIRATRQSTGTKAHC